MARIRTIKPEFFTSEATASLSLRERLTWVGLWTHADDHGRLRDHAAVIRGALWPLDDVSAGDVEDDLCALSKRGRIVRYVTPDGKRFLAVVAWHEHQKVNRPSPSRFPGPPALVNPVGLCRECDVPGQTVLSEGSLRTHGAFTEGSVNAHGTLTVGSGSGSGSGKEGEGEGECEGKPPRAPRLTEPSVSPHGATTRPPDTCPTHAGMDDPPPCGRCAAARRAAEAWRPPTPTPKAPDCPDHPGHPSGRCRRCEAAAVPPPPGLLPRKPPTVNGAGPTPAHTPPHANPAASRTTPDKATPEPAQEAQPEW